MMEQVFTLNKDIKDHFNIIEYFLNKFNIIIYFKLQKNEVEVVFDKFDDKIKTIF